VSTSTPRSTQPGHRLNYVTALEMIVGVHRGLTGGLTVGLGTVETYRGACTRRATVCSERLAVPLRPDAPLGRVSPDSVTRFRPVLTSLGS